MKIAINAQYGGFSLSEAAYEKLIEWGIPCRTYKEQERDPATHRFIPESENDGQVIFDRAKDADPMSESMRRLCGRYWDSWTRDKEGRTHPLVIRAIEELGAAAGGRYSTLKIVEVPDDIEWEIDEYDGLESVEESHRSWS